MFAGPTSSLDSWQNFKCCLQLAFPKPVRIPYDTMLAFNFGLKLSFKNEHNPLFGNHRSDAILFLCSFASLTEAAYILYLHNASDWY